MVEVCQVAKEERLRWLAQVPSIIRPASSPSSASINDSGADADLFLVSLEDLEIICANPGLRLLLLLFIAEGIFEVDSEATFRSFSSTSTETFSLISWWNTQGKGEALVFLLIKVSLYTEN